MASVTDQETCESTAYNVLTSGAQEPTEYQKQSIAGAVGGGGGGGAVLDLGHAVYPIFVTRKARLSTFRSWDPNHLQKPSNLVDLGFFYSGFSDCARCFYCGLGLRNWKSHHDAAVQHARLRPHCAFILCVLGQEFVDEIQRNEPAQPDVRDNQIPEPVPELVRDNQIPDEDVFNVLELENTYLKKKLHCMVCGIEKNWMRLFTLWSCRRLWFMWRQSIVLLCL